MKILLVAHGLPPTSVAGVEVYTDMLARRLGERHEVTVFAARTDPSAPDLAEMTEPRAGYRAVFVNNRFTDYDVEKEIENPRIGAVFGNLLDRERPEVVHFHHFLRLSATCLDEAAARGIPLLATLHDYSFLCAHTNLLWRDLRVCATPADPRACATCDAATAFLNRHETEGYVAGVLPETTTPHVWDGLARIYAGDLAPIFGDAVGAESEKFFERRHRLLAHQRRRLLRCRRLLAPSRHLLKTFAAAGVPRDRLVHCPYGIEVERFGGVHREPRRGPLRVGFLGTLNKHKGPHLVLQAFAKLPRGLATLRVFGGGSDRKYEAWLRRLAEPLGAVLAGGYAAGEAPSLLASLDVVAFASLWVENYPIVLQEAFAARVPVVAPRFGAIEEIVREGEGGLLFEPRDPASLAAVLERLATDARLLASLRRRIPLVKTAAEHVREHERIYEEVVAAPAP